MMNLGLMKTFFDTVPTDGPGPVAEQIIARWPIGAQQVNVWRASANFVFHVKADGGEYFLRFNHESEREAGMIEAELAFASHLSDLGIRVNLPVSSGSGNLLESVSTPLGIFHAVLFDTVKGDLREFDSLGAEAFASWGRTLGRMHGATRGFQIDHRPSWKTHIEFARRNIPLSEEAAQAELNWIEEQLELLPTGSEDYGLIHYDFELDNLLWEGNDIGVIDLDDCAFHWFEADIAYALRDLFGDSIASIDFEDKRLIAFVDGYRSQKTIGDEAIRRLPLFLRLHNLVATARINRSIGNGPAPSDPEWVVDLDGKLRNKKKWYTAEFDSFPVARFLQS